MNRVEKNILWIIGVIVILVLFNHMMKKDKEHLCGNEATAYSGC